MEPTLRFDRREMSGAVADLGVMLPIAVTLIVVNGLSPTAALLPAAVLYLAAAAIYRLPIPVQPLKAFGAIAIAEGLGADAIAAGALLMGAVFVTLGQTGLLDRAARVFPRAVVRGVQLTVGLLFCRIAWGLLTDPPAAFAQHALPTGAALACGAGAAALLFAFRRTGVALALVAAGVVVMGVTVEGAVALGPAAVEAPRLDAPVLLTALTLLVIPQVPLSFANSCLATADAARTYFGDRARAVRPGRLATSFGAANLVAGALSGMPVCHGAGGLTAHYKFGARTAAAPLVLGLALLALALGAGAGLATLLPAFPLPILAALLAAAGVLHIGLLRDLEHRSEWAVALLVAALGLWVNLALGLLVGLAAAWGAGRASRLDAAASRA